MPSVNRPQHRHYPTLIDFITIFELWEICLQFSYDILNVNLQLNNTNKRSFIAGVLFKIKLSVGIDY